VPIYPHHDGYLREKFLAKIVALESPLVAPYIIRLCGEYVIEILLLIHARLATCHRAHLRAFIVENPAFYEQNRCRMVSYWDCYHRGEFPKLREYVGYRIFKYLDDVAKSEDMEDNHIRMSL
jgi:hypothetical protein